MKMTRWLLLILLTLFQDSFVRLGTLLGLAAGYGSLQVIGGEPWINMSAYGFIGWGVGAYLGHHRSGKHLKAVRLNSKSIKAGVEASNIQLKIN